MAQDIMSVLSMLCNGDTNNGLPCFPQFQQRWNDGLSAGKHGLSTFSSNDVGQVRTRLPFFTVEDCNDRKHLNEILFRGSIAFG
jgi:hypothetical protein